MTSMNNHELFVHVVSNKLPYVDPTLPNVGFNYIVGCGDALLQGWQIVLRWSNAQIQPLAALNWIDVGLMYTAAASGFLCNVSQTLVKCRLPNGSLSYDKPNVVSMYTNQNCRQGGWECLTPEIPVWIFHNSVHNIV